MNAYPLVSVVIPSYNVRQYIEVALLSALQQTYRHLEIIVVNDGSTDDTLALVQSLQATWQDARLRIVDQDNRGLSEARNAGIRAASGSLIAFLDADDAWRLDKIERHVALFAANSRLGLSFSYSEYMTDAGQPTGVLLRTDRHAPGLHDLLARNHCGNGSTVVALKTCFDQAGLFRAELRSCEDYEMWCRILWATSFEAACIPQPLTLYRQRPQSLSFDVAGFTRNADLAMQYLRTDMQNVPARRFDRGHAEHYRIAAWRAATCGNDRGALRLLLRAARLHPPLLFTNARAAAMLLLLLVPLAPRLQLQRLASRFKQRFGRGATTTPPPGGQNHA